MITTPAQEAFFFLLSLRTSSPLSSSWVASMLTWWRSLSSCFLVNFPISVVTICIWRSLWRSAFLIYQGASTIFLSTLIWNRWMMSLLLCFMHPHSWMPQVHAGFSICLYSISVLCIDRVDLLPMIHYIFLYFSPSSSRFFLTRAFQRNLSCHGGFFLFAGRNCVWVYNLPFVTPVSLSAICGAQWYLVKKWKLCPPPPHLPVTCLRRGSEYFMQHPQPLFFHQEVSERERERASHAHKTLGQSITLFLYDF